MGTVRALRVQSTWASSCNTASQKEPLEPMSSAAKTSSVRLFVALAGLLTGIVNLLGALVRLLLVAVTALTGLVQRLAASAAQPSKASAPGPVAVARTTSWMPQGGPLAAPFRPTLPAIPVAAVPAVPAPPMPAVRRTAPYGLHVASPVQMVHGEVVRGVPLPLPVPPTRPTFHLPAADHLTRGRSSVEPCQAIDKQNFAEKGAKIVETLAHYGVVGTVQDVLPGPTVTTYEIAPAPGTKVSKVSGLADDIALALASKVRIIAPIPGKNRIGVEMPNDVVVPVALRDLIEDPHFQSFEAALPVVLGRDTVGSPVYADLANMPHIILAGATGSGKSVGLNVMLLSLLYRRTPDELRLLMIDPKVVELAPFDRIPHMLLPVVTDMKQAATALRWAVSEMERRYQLFANAGTRNIAGYNAACGRIERGEQLNPNGQDAPPGKLPYIVIVVDEFADLMMQQGKDRGADRASGAEGARRRHARHPRHTAPERRGHHGRHQGELPEPYRLPRLAEGRLAHHPRRAGCRPAARQRRHARQARRRRVQARAGSLGERGRGRARHRLPPLAGRARLLPRHPADAVR